MTGRHPRRQPTIDIRETTVAKGDWSTGNHRRIWVPGWRAEVAWKDIGLRRVASIQSDNLECVAYLVALTVCAVESGNWDRIPVDHHAVAASDAFGYWAGPTHEAEGGGDAGAVPMVSHPARIIAGIDHETYEGTSLHAYTRRPMTGEW